MTHLWLWQHPDWPAFKWDLGALATPLAAAAEAQGQLRMVARLLDPDLTLEARAALLKIEGLSTSAIEGAHLQPASVAASVARHLRLAWDPKAPHSRDADGLVGLLCDATEQVDQDLTATRLCGWQKALFPESRSGLRHIYAGALRPGEVLVQSGPAGREVVDFEGVPRAGLEADLDAFLDWFNGPSRELHGLIRAGLAHLWLVSIHPFEDGNGRIARAVTDLALAQAERGSELLFRMSARIEAVKGEYYSTLQAAQAFAGGLDATPWLAWFLAQVAEACAQSGQVIRSTLAKAAFWVRHRDAGLNERQRQVLNRLLDAGPGQFEGGLNARKYGAIAGTTKPTATRDLADLVERGCLVKVGGGGRSTAYDLPWEHLLAP